MSARRRRKKEPSLIEMAMTKRWEFSAWLAFGGLFVTVIVIPGVIGTNKHLGGLAPLLQIPGVILTGLFALISLVKFFTSQKTSAPAPYEFSKSPAVSQPRRPVVNDEPLNSEWGHSMRRPQSATANERPTHWSLGLLQNIEWKRFEEVVAAYFRETGYRAETIRCGADGGVDAKIYRGDELISIVQCKAWNSRPVGVKPVRELLGVMADQKVSAGIFFATGGFTNEAFAFATKNPLTLISGDEFLKTIYALPEAAQQRLLVVATEGDYMTPSCPSCGIKMVQREGGGKMFWGCQNFPRCRQKFFVAN